MRFVTATELMTIYADTAMTRSFRPEDLLRLARAVQKEITFQKLDGYALSAADVFGLLTDAMAGVHRAERSGRRQTKVTALDGPVARLRPADRRHAIVELPLERVRAGGSRDLRLLPDVPPPARRNLDWGGEPVAG